MKIIKNGGHLFFVKNKFKINDGILVFKIGSKIRAYYEKGDNKMEFFVDFAKK